MEIKPQMNLIFQDRRLVVSGEALTLERHQFNFQSPTLRGIAMSFIVGHYLLTFFQHKMHRYCL